jgi:hypothetical protein
MIGRCPICEEKFSNCDCTAKEREQFGELEEAEEELEQLRARVAELEAAGREMRDIQRKENTYQYVQKNIRRDTPFSPEARRTEDTFDALLKKQAQNFKPADAITLSESDRRVPRVGCIPNEETDEY